jgi:hypothetical protein
LSDLAGVAGGAGLYSKRFPNAAALVLKSGLLLGLACPAWADLSFAVSFTSGLSNTIVGNGTIDVNPPQCIMGSLCVPGAGLNDLLLTVDSLSFTLADTGPFDAGLILGQPPLLLYMAPAFGPLEFVVNPSPPPFNRWSLNTASKSDSGTYVVSPVPEPAAIVLLATSLAMLILLRRGRWRAL